MTEKLENLQDENESAQRTLGELTTDIEERKGESDTQDKYEVLFKRDKAMTEFIDNFDSTKQHEEQEQAKTRDMIVALLEHISRDLARRHNMPTQGNLKAMK